MGKQVKAAPPYASLEELFAKRENTPSGMPEKDVPLTIGGTDRTIRIRGLSRAEALAIRDIDGTAALEQFMLARSMVTPAMTEADVARWQASSLGLEMEPIVDEITELSGMRDEKAAMKEAVKAFEDDPDAEFPSLPGTKAGDDAGPDARGDAE